MSETKEKLKSRLKKVQRQSKVFLAGFLFFSLMILILVGLPDLNFRFYPYQLFSDHLLIQKTLVPLVFWLLVSVQVFVVSNLMLPVLFQIFIPNERIRDPKTIIRFSEKFRSLGLNSPTFILIPLSFWPRIFEGVIGFQNLPNPFNAAVLIKKSIYDDFKSEEFDFYCLKISYYLKNYRSRFLLKFYFLGFFPIFYARVFSLSAVDLFQIEAGFLFLMFVIQWVKKLELDELLIFSLEGLPSVYWNMEQKISLPISLPRFRKKRAFSFSTSRPLFLKTKLIGALQFIFVIGLVFNFSPPVSSKSAQRTLPYETPTTQAVLTANDLKSAERPSSSGEQMAKTGLEVTPTDDMVSAQELSDSSAGKSNSDRLNVSSSPHLPVAPKPSDTAQIFFLIEKKDTAAIRSLLFDPLTHTQTLQQRNKNFQGATILQWAAKHADIHLVYMLSLAGAKTAELDENDQNILFYAVENPQAVAMMNYLLQIPINLNQRNSQGQTVLDVAQEKNLNAVQQLLEKKGALRSSSL